MNFLRKFQVRANDAFQAQGVIPDRTIDTKHRHSSPLGIPLSPASEKKRVAMMPRTHSELTILSAMDERFYSTDFDAVLHCFNALPLDCLNMVIEEELGKLDRLRSIITAKLFKEVLQNYTSFVGAMQHVKNIEMDLASTIVLISSTRRSLLETRRLVVDDVFSSLRLQRRKHRIQNLASFLDRISNLVRHEQDFRSSLTEFRFEMAFRALKKCHKFSDGLERVIALKPLLHRLDSSADFVHTHLDRALDIVTEHTFGCENQNKEEHQDLFSRVANAFVSLENPIDLGKRLFNSFISHLDRSLIAALSDSVVTRDAEDIFVSLCADIDDICFASKFFSALSAASRILYSYFKTRQLLETLVTTGVLSSSLEPAVQYLSQQRSTIWLRVQHRLAHLLLNTSPASGELGEVMRVLTATNQLMTIGERFGGNDSSVLRPALHQRCKHYFQAFRIQNIERLLLTLESDTWHRLPLPSSFDILDVKELKFEACLTQRNEHNTECEKEKLFTSFAEGNDLFVFDGSFAALQSPTAAANFAAFADTNNNNDNEQQTTDKFQYESILTSTTMVCVRFLAHYIAIMRAMRPVADLAVKAMKDIFYMLLYAIFCMCVFDASSIINPVSSLSEIMRVKHPTLHAAIISCVQQLKNGDFCSHTFRLQCNISKMIETNVIPLLFKPPNEVIEDLETVSSLRGFVRRYVSASSLVFIVRTLTWMNNTVSKYLNVAARNQLHELSVFACDAQRDLVSLTLTSLAPSLVDWRPIMATISTNKFDLQELSVTHNAYIDRLLQMFNTFSCRVNACKADVCEESRLMLWRQVVEPAVKGIVDGFAGVKRCSTEGRAAMSIDLNVLLKGLRDLCGIWPIPGAVYAEQYISCFYLPAHDFLAWVSEHPEYSLFNIIAVARVGPGASMKKKAQAMFIDSIKNTHERIRKVCEQDSLS